MNSKFTLIELLVVISIIGILVTILLPSLRRAREKVKTAVCVSNVSQINKALQTYVSVNNNRMPSKGLNDSGSTKSVKDSWPSFLDPFVGGPKFTTPTTGKRNGQSEVWGSCPNSFGEDNFPKFRNSDYAGIFPRSKKWFTGGLGIISDPANSAIFTEGNHEHGENPEHPDRMKLGNSWLSVGDGVTDDEYNKITGISWNRVRHDFGKVFTLSTFDGAAKSTRWMNRIQFSTKYGIWVNSY